MNLWVNEPLNPLLVANLLPWILWKGTKDDGEILYMDYCRWEPLVVYCSLPPIFDKCFEELVLEGIDMYSSLDNYSIVGDFPVINQITSEAPITGHNSIIESVSKKWNDYSTLMVMIRSKH